MAKRSAKVQISQLNPEAQSSSSSDNEISSSDNKAKRQISVPKSLVKQHGDDEKFWLAVRALNQEFQRSLQLALEKDPLSNLQSLFTQYSKYWNSLKKDDVTLPAAAPPVDMSKAFAMFKPQAKMEIKEVATPALADPPQPTITLEAPKPTVSFDAPKQMSFDVVKPAVSVDTVKPAITFDAPKPAMAVEASKPTISFGAPKPTFSFDAPKPAVPIDAPKQTFSFGAAQQSSFSFSAPASTPLVAVASSESKDTSINQAAAPATLAFPAPASTTPALPAVAPTFSFTAPAGNASPFAAPAGTTLFSAPTSNVFSAPASGTNLFSAPASGSSLFSAANSGNSLFSATPSTSIFSAASNREDEDDDGVPEGEEESFRSDRTNNELIKTGAGEEDEECRVEVRAKIFVMQEKWVDLGVAIVKVNERKDDAGKGRLLARQEGSGKVLLNASLNAMFERTGGDAKAASLTLVNDGKLGQYLIRCKLPSEISQLVEAAQKYYRPPQ